MSGGARRPDPPVPDPVREIPPEDRFCDLILNGGVASGVVYPWCIVELARHYRFRNIGGNSVGAMAAALAAAAEYGRCHGRRDAFEVLRRSPGELAEEQDGRTQMLRLFQPGAGLRRLFDCLLVAIRHLNAPQPVPWAKLLTIRDVLGQYHVTLAWLAGVLALLLPALGHLEHPWRWGTLLGAVVAGLVGADHAARRANWPGRAGILAVLALVLAGAHVAAIPWVGFAWFYAALLWLPLVLLLAWWFLLRPELRAFRDNGWGLCTGRAQPDAAGAVRDKALVEWLHEGIQRGAGREQHDAPLTFEELWKAPRFGAPPEGESISLHMFSTNVTLGRPVAWPLVDRNTRLFFRKEEWARIFPPTLLEAVCKAAVAYAPANDSDPPVSARTAGYYEVPSGGMPIAVAARLSLSFPFLFTFVPVHAIDYEQPKEQRELRKCLLTDGGLCTNFPIHLFDAAHPRWPTFGLMLSRRITTREDQAVWLPDYHLEGRADNWLRSVPGADRGVPCPAPFKGLTGLLIGMVGTMLEWNDNLVSRLPQARNRVLRMALRTGEGQLNIAMPRATILQMAHEYGTQGGHELVKRFVSASGAPTVAWREHLYVRAMNQLQALAGHVRGYAGAVTAAGFSRPLAEILAEATRAPPLRSKEGRAPDLLAGQLTDAQAAALGAAVQAIAGVESALEHAAAQFGPYQPVPPTKLQLRSRL